MLVNHHRQASCDHFRRIRFDGELGGGAARAGREGGRPHPRCENARSNWGARAGRQGQGGREGTPKVRERSLKLRRKVPRESEVADLDGGGMLPIQQRVVQLQVPALPNRGSSARIRVPYSTPSLCTRLPSPCNSSPSPAHLISKALGTCGGAGTSSLAKLGPNAVPFPPFPAQTPMRISHSGFSNTIQRKK